MIRLIFFLCALVGVAWAVVWMADNPGQMSLNWGGWQIQTSASVLAFVVLVFATTVAVAYRFWVFITRAPGRIGNALKDRRSQKGYKALTKGMVAVAAGDAGEAQNQVKKADGLLGEPPLTLLLKAQAAQLGGDETAAETFFQAMLENPEMEFLGLRGLLTQATKRGDEGKALELARRAQALKPKSTWLADTVFDLESRNGNWLEAEAALTRIGKMKAVTKAEAVHRQAVVLLGQSLAAEQSGQMFEALKRAQKAVSEDAGFAPAAVRYARLCLADGNKRKAKSVAGKAWEISPHPDLATVYLEASDGRTALKKVASAEKLLALNPDSAEGHIVVARAALDAKLWGPARQHLQVVLDGGHATRTVYSLMARLEDEDRGDKDQARKWLAQAASAAADPAWVCDKCGHVEPEWHPHCPKCKSFDALGWKTPPGYEALETFDNLPVIGKIESLKT